MNFHEFEEKKRLKDGLIFAGSLVLLLWIVRLSGNIFGIDFSDLGIIPRNIHGLKGIVLAPLIHKDLMHLFSNSVPLFLSIIGIFYFFRKVAFDVILFSGFLNGILTWIFARDGIHIGASGLVYTYISFLFFGGAFANNKNLLALTLILIFLYGTLFWGMLPVKTDISWESHLMGALSGLVFALIYRKSALPEPKTEDWDDENDLKDNENVGFDDSDEQNHFEKAVNEPHDFVT